jgi:hypothetical protein
MAMHTTTVTVPLTKIMYLILMVHVAEHQLDIRFYGLSCFTDASLSWTQGVGQLVFPGLMASDSFSAKAASFTNSIFDANCANFRQLNSRKFA